jgi:hypothetical protein
VVAALLLVGALFFRLRIESFVRGRRGAVLGPEFWPATLLSIAIVLSAIYLVLAIIWARRQSAELEAESARTAASATAPTATEPPTPSTGGSTAMSTGPHTDEDTSASPAGGTAPVAAENTGSAAKLVGGFVLLAAFIYLLGPIGFVPAAFLFSVAFMLLVGERRWWVLLLFPVVAVTILLGIFTQLLVVSLPRGTGIFIDLSTYLY